MISFNKGFEELMNKTSQSIVQQAVAHFKQGHYQQAKTCYQKAAQTYGSHLFANSIRLCELRMNAPTGRSGISPTAVPGTLNYPQASAEARQDEASVARQLEETQKLLEHYFKRCQELEYQLQDR